MEGKALLLKLLADELKSPGVYILYRDEHPYYVGKTKRPLFSRLHDHANKSTDKYFYFWNYFSFFLVPDPDHIDEIEGILIASMATANGASPKIDEVKLPAKLAQILRRVRRKKVEVS
ncbi:MAG: GIY-YIG nuclease family protein [Acidobacteriota bacterium]